jgi:endonuclease YncB( thermonuclease family)
MLHIIRSTIVVLGLLALSACSRPHSLFVEEPARSAGPVSLVSVVQADALVVDGRRVHLVDAITPQPAPDAGCPAEALAARQARLRMTDLAARTRHVDVKPTGTLDGYNRANAHVLFDGRDPAETLIDEGLAVAPDKQAFNWCGPLSSAFPQAQRLAALSLTGS